jgi:hypothetical protein
MATQVIPKQGEQRVNLSLAPSFHSQLPGRVAEEDDHGRDGSVATPLRDVNVSQGVRDAGCTANLI